LLSQSAAICRLLELRAPNREHVAEPHALKAHRRVEHRRAVSGRACLFADQQRAVTEKGDALRLVCKDLDGMRASDKLRSTADLRDWDKARVYLLQGLQERSYLIALACPDYL